MITLTICKKNSIGCYRPFVQSEMPQLQWRIWLSFDCNCVQLEIMVTKKRKCIECTNDSHLALDVDAECNTNSDGIGQKL